MQVRKNVLKGGVIFKDVYRTSVMVIYGNYISQLVGVKDSNSAVQLWLLVPIQMLLGKEQNFEIQKWVNGLL